MPIYEYQCLSCGQVVEAFQKFSDAPLKKCKHCSGKLKRLVSCTSFQLKGSGWYVTDYSGRNPSHDKVSSEGKAEKKDTCAAKTETTVPDTPAKESKAKATDG